MMDFCEFFRKLAANPSAKITGLTIGDWEDIRDHAHSCEECMNIIQQVVDEAPPEQMSDLFGEN